MSMWNVAEVATLQSFTPLVAEVATLQYFRSEFWRIQLPTTRLEKSASASDNRWIDTKFIGDTAACISNSDCWET